MPGPEAIRMTKAKIWTIYKFASKLTWIGVIEAKTEKEAIEIAAKEFKVAAYRHCQAITLNLTRG